LKHAPQWAGSDSKGAQDSPQSVSFEPQVFTAPVPPVAALAAVVPAAPPNPVAAPALVAAAPPDVPAPDPVTPAFVPLA